MEKSLNTPLLTLYGTGTILGAGIYVLIGKIAGEAGYWMPLAFLLAALVAAVNGMVYAELSTRHPSAGGPTEYVKQALKSRWFASVIGWMIVATGVVSAATIANGFAGYLAEFVQVPAWLTKSLLLLTLGGVAIAGARESAWFMAITTTLGILGLLWILYLGFIDTSLEQGWESYRTATPNLTDGSVLTGVLAATFLAVYAFIGFEDMVHVAEETEKPKRAMPIAIVIALLVCAVLYIGVSIAALMVVEPDELAKSAAPLVTVTEKAGYAKWPLVLLSLWIILNGALAQIIMATRVLYNMGEGHGAPTWFGKLNNKTATPVSATVVTTLVILILSVAFPLKALASATSLIMLLIFIASNVALIILERRKADAPFDVPVFLPWVGLVLSLALMIGNFLVKGSGH
nr:amino acid permease [Bowmanella dokdonensis]